MYLLELYYCRKVFAFVDRAVCNDFTQLRWTIRNHRRHPTPQNQQRNKGRSGTSTRVPIDVASLTMNVS